MIKKIILASESKARSQLLSTAGIEHLIIPANINEHLIREKNSKNDPEDIAFKLAFKKAETVSSNFGEDVIIIGCDQVLCCEDKLYEKPGNKQKARTQLEALKNKRHKLITSICVISNQKLLWHHTNISYLTMFNFSSNFLDKYMGTIKHEIYSPGAYHLEGLGATLFEKVEGDYFSILGLPLIPLLSYLRKESFLIS